MQEKRLNLEIDLLNNFMYFYLSFCILSPVIYSITHSESSIWLSFAFLPLMLLSLLIRNHTRQIITFALFHLCLMALPMIFPISFYIKIVLIIPTILLSLINFGFKIRAYNTNKSNISPFMLIFIVASYLICNYLNYNFLLSYIYYGLLICCLIYFINYYLINYRNYFFINRNKSNLPMPQIRKMGGFLIGLFTLLSCILMLLITKVPIYKFLHLLGGLFISLLRFIFSKLSKDTPPPASEGIPNQTYDRTVLPEIDDSKYSLFLHYLYEILYVVCIVLTIVAIIAVIVAICIAIYKKFHTVKPDAIDTTEFISPFGHITHISRKKEKETSRSFFLWSTNNQKIRRHFYREIKPKVNSEKAPYYTSKQLTDSLHKEVTGLLPKSYAKDDLLSLRTLYDKARYSNEECSKEEYQKMKHIKL